MLTFLDHYLFPFITSYVHFGLYIWMFVSGFFCIALLPKGNFHVSGLSGIQCLATHYSLDKYADFSHWPAFTDFDNFYKIACMNMFAVLLIWLIIAVLIPFFFARFSFILFLFYLGVLFWGL